MPLDVMFQTGPVEDRHAGRRRFHGARPATRRSTRLGGIDTITFGFKLTDATVSYVGNRWSSTALAATRC